MNTEAERSVFGVLGASGSKEQWRVSGTLWREAKGKETTQVS